ncbi:hypothetical protein [Chloroflexus aggregans]|nr:hypothetical protein [Chloroflexus aggregans]
MAPTQLSWRRLLAHWNELHRQQHQREPSIRAGTAVILLHRAGHYG